MDMPGRQYGTQGRYGFNGKEKDKEGAVQYDYGFRIYDPRLVRFKSTDPLQKKFAGLTPYQFASNSPIAGVDLDGKEFKLSIYDPVQAQNFLNAYNAGDLYQARWIAYQAANSTFSAEEEKAYLDKKGTRVMHHNSAGQLMKGSLTYDKSSPPGVTLELSLNKSEVKSYEFIEQETSYWPKGTGSNPEAGYPVDVKTINSPEHQDFYGGYDFVAKYRLTYGSPVKVGPAAAEGWIDGNLKGYGNVAYDFKAFGLGTRGIGQEMGMLTGNFNLKNTSDFSPSVIAGYGGSYTYGAGMAVRGQWYSFPTQGDMLKFNTANSTISGELNAWSFGFGGPKITGSLTYSITTLREPLIIGQLGTAAQQQPPKPNP
jgi:RHS repeat-associated protein